MKNSIVTEEDTECTEEELEGEEGITQVTVSHATACNALQTVLTYLEQQPATPMDTVVILNGLLLETARKRLITKKQTQIKDYFSN